MRDALDVRSASREGSDDVLVEVKRRGALYVGTSYDNVDQPQVRAPWRRPCWDLRALNQRGAAWLLV